MEENNNPSPEPNYDPQPGIQSASVENKPPMSNENRTIITVLLLVFVYPIGLIVMWMWMKWPTWVKVVLTALVFVPFILGILLAITLIAINPARQFSQANNTKRTSDVNAILNSVSQFAVENNGTLPGSIPNSAGNVSSEEVNLCSYLVPHYLSALPVDPSVNEGEAVADCSRTYDTGYTIMLDANGHVVVSAPKAELNTSISVSR